MVNESLPEYKSKKRMGKCLVPKKMIGYLKMKPADMELTGMKNTRFHFTKKNY